MDIACTYSTNFLNQSTYYIIYSRRGVQSTEEVNNSAEIDRNPLGDYERAEKEIFNHVEDFEKAAINVAHDMVHDEVDILFGKNHGHATSDDGDDNTSTRRRSRSDRKEVKQMQMSTKKVIEEENASEKGNDSTSVNTYTPSNSLWYCE